MLYCIPLFLISCPQVSIGVQTSCNFPVPQHPPLPSAASNLSSKLCHHPSYLSLESGDSEISSSGSPQTGQNVANRFRSFPSILRERQPEIEPRPSDHATWGRSGTRARKNATNFPTVLHVAFSWLGVCLVITDPLIGCLLGYHRAPTKLS